MKIEKADDVWFIINGWDEDLMVEEHELEWLCVLLLKRRADLREKQQGELVEWILQRVFK